MPDTKKKIALLSNITVDLLIAALRQYAITQPQGFDTWVQEALNPASPLWRENPDAVVVLLDGTEARSWKDRNEGEERIAFWKSGVRALVSGFASIPIFVSTVDFRENRIKALSERMCKYAWGNDWYQFVQDLAESRGNVYVLDLVDTIAEIGRERFYSNKMWYMSSMPYARDGLKAVAQELDRALGSAFQPRKKIIALDLDNTLWGGVVGEDGVDGIELSDHKEGQRYYDFQRQLLEMKNRGILLALNSKNNPEDAEAAMQNHPHMLLRDEDFVCRKINWENKASNLKAMERELNLTEGGFIFIDDNPAEREIVKGACPEALVPDFPRDTTELLPFAEEIWLDHCRPLHVLREDAEKTQMYQNDAKRRQEQSESLSLDDYLAKLKIRADIHRMRPEERERVLQLIQKTNQFNVTTKRYAPRELDAIEKNPNDRIYVLRSADKYGDNGLCGVLILMREGMDTHIDTFLMSCRVMGRKLEDVILDKIASAYPGRLTAVFLPTAKNAPVRDLYDRLGFTKIAEENGQKTYVLDTVGYMSKPFPFYEEIHFEP